MGANSADEDKDLQFYFKSLVIDRDNLAWECEQQPHLHAKIGREAARRHSLLSAQKLAIKRSFGEMSKKYRKSLGKGTTVAEIKAAIEADLNYQVELENRDALAQTCREWDALKDACRDRGFMISKLVDAWIGGLLSSSGENMTKTAQAAAALKLGSDLEPKVSYEQGRDALAQARASTSYDLDEELEELEDQEAGGAYPQIPNTTREQL